MAQSVETITDAKGRKLVVRELNVLQQTRLLRAIGPVQSQNVPYVGAVMSAAMVTEIEGVPCRPISSERDIDAAIERLDDEGMMAVAIWRDRKIKEATEALEAATETASPLASSAPSPSSPPSDNASASSTTA